ncbi:ATP-binding protein [Nocardia spumae]|uniref:ATP-binding protein n=1 Tax=Nocardia spumae TaxID=2887190 RepID=UPI0027E01E7B|nr:ATP-binding protein [Nocardia spumae]
MTLSWILAAILILTIAGALYAAYYASQQRTRARSAEAELRAHEDELEHFTSTTMGLVADSVRRAESTVELPAIDRGGSRFAQLLQRLTERYADDLHRVAAETHERTSHELDYEKQQAISATETSTREKVENASREATSAAVRAFGTSVVSLGADVSQVVSAALREHRGDDVYETLIRIDHSVQQMIRQAQSYVIVCGGLPGRRWPQQALTDIVGGAVGRVRDFTRVRPQQLDRVVISRAVEPLVHTLATLLDNALRYSPPTSFVDVTFQEGHHGLTVIIDDAGVRMNPEQMEEARQVLAGERTVDIHQLGPTPRVGFPGIAALARRYGFTVYIDGPNIYGGMRAMVYVPEGLLAARPDNAAESVTAPPISTPVETPAAAPAPVAVPAPAPVAVPSSIDIPAAVSISPAPAPVAAVPEPVSSSTADPNPTGQSSTVHEITPGGLPRRRRRSVAAPASARGPRTDTGLSGPRTDTALPRVDIAEAWQTGSTSGRAAAHDNSEGMTS